MATTWKAPTWRMPNEKNQSKFESYSLDFSLTNNNSVNIGNNILLAPTTNPFTFSAWIKPNNWTATYSVIYSTPITNGIWIGKESSNGFVLRASNDANYLTHTLPSVGVWTHIIITRDVNNTTTLYYNGISQTSATITKDFVQGDTYIGSDNANNEFDGSISNVTFFDYAISSTQIASLYNSGSPINPMTLKPAPIAYYPLGGNASTGGDSTNTLSVPNIAVPDASVFDFDVAKSIKTSAISITSSSTFSLWFKKTANSAQSYGGTLLSTPYIYNASYNNTWAVAINNSNQLTLESYNGTSGSYTNPIDATTIANNTWNNLIGVLSYTDSSNSSIQFYLNGSSFGSAISLSGRTLAGISNGLIIGGYDFTGNGNANTYYLNGKISNVQIWQAELSSTEIETLYNSGVPLTGTQPQETNLKAWYKLDQSANWEADTAGNWQIPDAVSSYPQSFDFGEANAGGQYIDAPTNIGGFTKCSTSVWLNPSSVSARSTIFATNTANNFTAYFWTGNIIYVTVDGAYGYLAAINNYIDANKWNHLSIVYDGTFTDPDAATQNAGRLKMYVNGSYIAFQAISGTIPSSIPVSGSDNIRIGTTSPTTYEFGGELSNFTIYDTNLSSSQVETLYNNGTPLTTAIATDNLKAWYKLDNTATFSTNWSVPDASGNGNTGTSSGMTEQNLVNNNVSALNGESSGMDTSNLVTSTLTRQVPYNSYSLNFDSGNPDYIDCGTGLGDSLGTYTGDLTLSYWFNTDSLTANRGLFYIGSFSNAQGEFQVNIYANSMRFRVDGGTQTKLLDISGLSTGTWYHIAFVYKAGNISDSKVYLNGVDQSTTDTGTFPSSLSFSGLKTIIGGYYGTGNTFDGKMNNLSLFNETLTSTEVMKLYNSGVPGDLSNFNPTPVSWWSLGSDSYYNGANYICPDLIGTNNGTSSGMDANALIGDAPNSTANGTSTNMAIDANLTGNAPNSSNNSFSVNMDYTDRETSVPS